MSGTASRLSTGIPKLDELLGGGLLPGRLTVVVGATGIGKTQLGVQFANAGASQEGKRGIIFDCTSRGDSQNHADYAERMAGWKMKAGNPDSLPPLDHLFDPDMSLGDYLAIFRYQGRRVTKRDLSWEEFNDWQAELNSRLRQAIGFFYGNFVKGVRRAVLDGIEPTDKPTDSIQLHLLEYVYHQILRKDPEWVARDLFREQFRHYQPTIEKHPYNPEEIGSMLLYTSHAQLLDELITKPLDEGDVLSNANTIIYMGKIRQEDRMTRGLYIAKHRGSRCDERIVPYTINDAGLQLLDV